MVILTSLALLAGLLYWQYGDLLKLENLAQRESELRQFETDHPALAYGIAFAIYVVITGLSLPGAAGLTLLYGWFFGLLPAVILVSFASTTGATIAFLLSRYLLHDSVQNKFGERLASFNDALRREGAFYLFTLRLVFGIPFFVINVVMGLTPIRTTTFWWVSQLGMLPGTILYCYAGSRVPSLMVLAEEGIKAVFTPGQVTQLLVAFALLGVFPLIVRKLLGIWKPAAAPKDSSDP